MLQHPVLHSLGLAGWETSSLLNVLVGSSAVLGAAWAGTALMRHSSAARRHLVWCAALGAVLLLPALSMLLPAWHILPERFASTYSNGGPASGLGFVYVLPPLEIDATDAAGGAAAEAPAVEPAAWRIGPGTWLLNLWAAGTLLALMPAVLGRWLLRRVERTCARTDAADWDLLLRQAQRDIGVTQTVNLLLSASRAMPMTWGIRRPRVLLPIESQRWPADRRRVVLLHELGHVKRRDCLTHLLGQVARAAYWFHPLAWVAHWRMQVERERACDDLVLRLGTQQADYAHELVEVTVGLDRAAYAMAGIAMARPSRLEQRVREILDSRRNRLAATRRHVLVTVALAGLLAVPVAIIRGGGQVQAQTPKANPQEAAAAPVVATPPPAEPKSPSWDLWSPQARQCAENGRPLFLAVLNYASQHEWRLPPDLGATLPYAMDYDQQSGTFRPVPPAEAARYYLCPLDRARVAVPAAPTPEWINRNTSYAYLGGADVNLDALAQEQFDSAVVMYEKVAGAHPEMAGNPMALTLGGAPSPQTADRIAWSRQALDTTRGVPFPPQGQSILARKWERVQAAPKASECASHQATIARAIAMYLNDSRGYYPPTLGDTLKYMNTRYDPVTRQRVALTPQEAARMYLCPLEQDIEIPESITPEWINEHTSYVYLGDELLTEGLDPQAAILYERLDRGHADTANLLYGDLHAQPQPKDEAQAIIDRSIVMIEDDRADTAQRIAAKAASEGGNGAAPAPSASVPARRSADPNAARLAALRRLLQVLVEDTQDHAGRLPEDLIHVFKFATQNRGPKAPPPLEPRVAARLLLSPRAQKDLKVPDKPPRHWLEEKASYAYLGDKQLTVDLMQAAIPAAQWSQVVVLHEKPAEGDPQVAVATLDLVCRLVETKKATELIERSKATLAAARSANADPRLAELVSQPANQASHPAQRWRGKSTDDPKQTAAATKVQPETKTR